LVNPVERVPPPAPHASAPPTMAAAPPPPVIMPIAARIDVPATPATDFRFKLDTTPAHLPAAAIHSRPSPWPRVAVAVVILTFLTGAGLYAVRRRASASALTAGMGTLTVQSNPSGVPIDIDGKASGTTPATVALAPGTHT